MSKWCLTSFGVLGLAVSLRAQGPSDLGPREKTEVFIQHLVKVAKLDPTRYKALVLEYEIGAALVEMGKDHDEADHDHAEGGHAGGSHADGDDCCSGPIVGASVVTQNFIQAALREIHPEYAEAMKHAEEGRIKEASEIAKGLSLKSDPYLAAHASLLLAECQFALASSARDADAFSKTIETCEKLSQRDRLYLIDDHRACELIALCFEGLGKKIQESAQYAILLTDYNDLPKEVSERAKARLAALEEDAGRPLGTVATWMNRVEKLLGEEKTDKDPTQSQEIEIVSALDKLIELQEARERKTCPNCGSGQCRGGCKNGRPKGNRSQSPARVSALSQGKGEMSLHGVSRADAGTIWGQLKDRDASRALQGFRGKLPERYERLLEQYYKNLSKGE